MKKALGMLTEILFRLTGPISRFFAFAFGIHLGFSVGFFFLVRSQNIENYRDFSDTFYSVTKTFLSAVESEVLSNPKIIEIHRIFIQIIFSIYVALFMIILFNFLIALMTTEYNTIQSRAEARFRMSKTYLLFEFTDNIYYAPAPYCFFLAFWGF
jgi:hypothetical protein